MPALTTLDIAPTAVRRGDIILNFEGDLGPVASVDTKVKYVYFTDTSGKRIRWDIDAPVAVQRSVPTEAETAAELRELSIAQLTRQMISVLGGYATTAGKLADSLTGGYGVDHWDVEQLVAAQAEYRIWGQIKRQLDLIAEQIAEQGDAYEFAHVTIYDVVKDEVDSFTRTLIENANAGTSRSSNTMANAVEDVERAAKAKFVRDFTRYAR
jgi:hypothetical protein